jgi:hypothetical protein
MELNEELSARLEARIKFQIEMEETGNVDALYDLIDPAIRQGRVGAYDSEPDLTISNMREFVGQVQSAELVDMVIEAYSPDGGAVREHRPTAIVIVNVAYNGRSTPTMFRTPWVLENGEWYTRAVGKLI